MQSNIKPVIAKFYNRELTELPHGLYIDPEALQILLEMFEGPLDLLLYLIRRQNLNILAIPISEITNQYINYINAMQTININLAAEYLVMAATLLTIKSRLLLPKATTAETTDTSDQSPDPRQELINQLLEYEKIKFAATELYNIPQVERDYHWISVLYNDENKIKATISPTDLKNTWQKIMQNTLLSLLNKAPQKVKKQELSIHTHMELILNKLTNTKTTLFSSLFEYTLGINYVIVHFIAVLELAKNGLIKLIAEKNDIMITLHIN